MFSPMQKDVLVELLNVHIGQAASLLSEMVSRRVILTIPEVDIIRSDHTNVLEVVKSGFSIGQKVVSAIRFQPRFEGKAFLIFPIQTAKSLSNACMGLPSDDEDMDETELIIENEDFDVVKEVSNVVFNALIGEFGNLLGLMLDYTVPDVNVMTVTDSDKDLNLPANVNLMILHTKFLLTNNDLAATILIALSSESIGLLLEKINDILGELQ